MELLKHEVIITQVQHIYYSLILKIKIKINHLFLLVKYLSEDEIYTFQVFALANNDYQAGSNEFEILVPPIRRMRAIAIGATTGLLFLLAAAAVYIYLKKRCFNIYKESGDEKS